VAWAKVIVITTLPPARPGRNTILSAFAATVDHCPEIMLLYTTPMLPMLAMDVCAIPEPQKMGCKISDHYLLRRYVRWDFDRKIDVKMP